MASGKTMDIDEEARENSKDSTKTKALILGSFATLNEETIKFPLNMCFRKTEMSICHNEKNILKYLTPNSYVTFWIKCLSGIVE